MERVCCVILHYLVIEDTINCIESFIKTGISIVVVDNGSPDDSIQFLKEKYKNVKRIYFIKSNKNLGFAKGNNIGYKYAKFKLKSKFIILSNNDIVIDKEKFSINLILEKYEKESFDIMGPDIISLVDKVHQNPYRSKNFDEGTLRTFIKKNKILLLLSFLNLDLFIYEIFKKNTIEEKIYLKETNNYILDNLMLHGSFLIFSPSYVEKYDGLYEKTFMYMEENILKYIADRDNLNILYTPMLLVYHKEDSATNAFLKKEKYKRQFKYKNSIESAKIFLELIKHDQKIKKTFEV